MVFKSISVTFVGVAVLLTAPVYAKDSCEAYLKVSELSVPAYQSTQISPGKFQSRWRNQLSVWWNRKNLVEIPNVPVRTQCFGTCYLYSTQTVLETALKSQKILQPGDYLVNFMPMMKVAWKRYQEAPSKEINLGDIVDGGNNEGLEVANKGPTFYISAEALKALGGPTAVEAVEHKLIGSLMEKSWFFWDKHRRLRKLLSLDYDEFLEKAQEMLVKKLSKAAGGTVLLRSLSIASVDVTVYRKRAVIGGGFSLWRRAVTTGFKTTRFYRWSGQVDAFDDKILQEVAEHDFEVKEQPEKVGSPEWKRFESVEFGQDVIPDFLKNLEQNKAIDVGLSSIFVQANGEHGTHAISLIGAYFDRDEPTLKAFKYVNSWSAEVAAKGFGYLSRDLLQSYFENGLVIRSVNLAQQPADTP